MLITIKHLFIIPLVCIHTHAHTHTHDILIYIYIYRNLIARDRLIIPVKGNMYIMYIRWIYINNKKNLLYLKYINVMRRVKIQDKEITIVHFIHFNLIITNNASR